MKKIIPLLLMSLFFASSCLVMKETMKFDELIDNKMEIDATENPAKRQLLTRELAGKSVQIEDVLVKDIIPSTHIDYDFCVVAEMNVDGVEIECYIYSRNLKVMSELKKGKSRIEVNGEFGRFLAVVDGYYTRVEIMKASINIMED